MDSALLHTLHTFSPPKRTLRYHPHSVRAAVEEIRVCTNRTCRRQGSFQTLDIVFGLAPPNVAVKPSGCLGRCGAGPNLAVLPEGTIVGHCGTAARTAQVMVGLFADEGEDGAKRSLDALALRKMAEVEFGKQNYSEAEILLTRAIELNPFGGMHIIYKCRSIVRLALGNYSVALDDAKEALKLAPAFVEGFICQGDALLAMKEFDSAEKSYVGALDIDPSLRRSKSFKAKVTQLQEKLTAGHAMK